MRQQLASLAVDAAMMVVRGQDEVFDLVAHGVYELFGADGGVGFCRCGTDDAGAPQIRLHVAGAPPLDAAWMERTRELMPRTPSIVAFRHNLDDAVRDMTLQAARRAPALTWLGPMIEEYLPTRREAEVLALVADGWTNQQIATRLGISERTVRKHLSAVYERAGFASRAAAAGWWRSRGLHQG